KHALFANGRSQQLGPDRWRIEFPAYYNSNSLYLHVTDAELAVRSGFYRGIERNIPWVVYSKTVSAAREAASLMPKLFAELEGTYGPYLHDSFVAYISGKGGMEHAGAAVTSIG